MIIKFRFLSSPRAWEIGALSFLIITFQRDGSHIHEKPIYLGCKIGKRLGEIYLSKSQRNNLQLQVFQSKCIKKRKVRDLCSQYEICLKYSLAEGRLKAVLDQFHNCLCHELCELGKAIFPVMTRTMKVFDYRASIKPIMLKACVSEAII